MAKPNRNVIFRGFVKPDAVVKTLQTDTATLLKGKPANDLLLMEKVTDYDSFIRFMHEVANDEWKRKLFYSFELTSETKDGISSTFTTDFTEAQKHLLKE